MSDRRDPWLRANVTRRHWERPPADVAKGVRNLTMGDPVPARASRTQNLAFPAIDVRGVTGSGLSAGDTRMLAHVFEGAEVAIAVTPPAEGSDGCHVLSGTIWTAQTFDEPLQLLVVSDDHVLVEASVAAGEFFELRDVLPPKWALEIHLPGHPPLVLDGGTDA